MLKSARALVREYRRPVRKLCGELLEAATEPSPVFGGDLAADEAVLEEMIELPQEQSRIKALAKGDAMRVGIRGTRPLQRHELVDRRAVENGGVAGRVRGVPQRGVADVFEKREPEWKGR